MPSTPIRVTRDSARRFMRRAVLLDRPAPNLATALDHLGYVQIDPINVCGRMHDLILRHRVAGYRAGDLMRHLHGHGAAPPAESRIAFEHHLPTLHTLVALTPDAWPHLLAEMRQRMRRPGAWSGRLSPKQNELAVRILAEIAARGPLCSEDFAGTGRARAVWGSATQAKATLQKLFFHGRLLIARRGEDHRRYYDLPERVLPSAILRLPESTAAEAARWETMLKLRQRRLVLLTKNELPRVEDLVRAVRVEGCPLLHCLRSDLPLLEACQAGADGEPSPTLLLLAPLDPLIYDRRLTRDLWNFDYTWEAYTSPSKRKRGYYAQPVLAGTELVGHVDARADRSSGTLVVVGRSIRRPHRSAPAVADLARFLGLK
ncbi:MAG TPA: crosslink repair DNA glycosylase YcaQ family protein [Lacunisphaera sp.]|nr:crosslink repair DNA glycosylase YcaQ family protein [Lacunisphaera sp.]